MLAEMAFGPIVLPGLPHHPIPDVEFDALVHVDATRCAPPPAIAELHGTLQPVSMLEVVTRGAIQYQRSHFDPGTSGETEAEAHMRRAWDHIKDSQWRVVEIGGIRRLVITQEENDELTHPTSQILGMALATLLMERALRVSYTAFLNVHGRTDLEVLVGARVLKVEARGRFNHNGRARAVRELDKKFAKTRNYDRAIGVLAYPSDRPDRSFPDVELFDPPARREPRSPWDRADRVLAHYEEFFKQIGAYAAVAAIAEWRRPGHRQAWREMQSRRYGPWHWPALIDEVGIFGRQEIEIGGERFLGNVMPVSLPESVSRVLGLGARPRLFWGIWLPITRILGTQETLALLEPPEFRRGVHLDEDSARMWLSDGTVLVWTARPPEQTTESPERDTRGRATSTVTTTTEKIERQRIRVGVGIG